MSHYLPDLANLSLEGNRLRAWKDLDYLTGRRGKLSKLRELILTGNPIRELEYQNNRVDMYKRYVASSGSSVDKQHSIFRSNIARRFPSLEMLDQEPIATISFGSSEAPSSSTTVATKSTPQPFFTREMAGSFITGISSDVVNEFLTKYGRQFVH